jgi:hypothetical protein
MAADTPDQQRQTLDALHPRPLGQVRIKSGPSGVAEADGVAAGGLKTKALLYREKNCVDAPSYIA